MITRGLIEKIYDAASIQRWNDQVRPIELTELDKQAHKMIIAYVIAKFEEKERQVKIEWRDLIEGGIFEFLQRALLTDIKPTVFHRIMMKKGDQLNNWVLKNLEDDIANIKNGFKDKFKRYLFSEEYTKERKILKAAHYLATNWEFKIIYHSSPFIYGIEKTKEEIDNQIEDHYDLIGVQKILLAKKSFGFTDLCGQLRFQQRWAQTPRTPKTSVLGHMLVVAIMSYLFSVEIGACSKRIYNNFFAALFHDLPEVLTRDIISPVKGAVVGLREIIKEYEKVQMEEKILPLLPTSWHEEMKYFVEDEFANKIMKKGEILKGLKSEEISEKYNQEDFSPIDGELINICDKLATFTEAAISIKLGIVSPYLERGKNSLYEECKSKEICGIRFGNIFDYFR